jgi:hypothetical protein
MSNATIGVSLKTSEHSVRGEELLAKVKELVHQGNVRRLVVLTEDGNTVLEIPLAAGVVGALVAPALVAIGAIAALAKNYTLRVETTDEDAKVDPEC